MLTIIKKFKKSVLIIAGLLLALQLHAAEPPRSGSTLSWGRWPKSLSSAAAPRSAQSFQANPGVSSMVSGSASSTVLSPSNVLSPVEPIGQPAPLEISPSEQAQIRESVSKKNEQFRLEQEREQRAAIDQEILERREQRAYAAREFDPVFQRQKMAEYDRDLALEKQQIKTQSNFIKELERKEKLASIQRNRENKLRLQAKERAQAAQLEKDRAEFLAWEATYEKDLAAEKRDRALLAGRKFATPEPKTRYDQMLAEQELNLVVSQATDMLRTLLEKEEAARAIITENSGMLSTLFAGPKEWFMRGKRIELAQKNLQSIRERRKELDAALAKSSAADQLAELKYVQGRIDHDPNIFNFEILNELIRAEEREAAAERERAAILGAEMLAETRGKQLNQVGQERRSVDLLQEQDALVELSEAVVSPEDLERYGQSEVPVQDFPPAVEQLENLGLDSEEEAAALAQPSPAPAPEQVAPEVAGDEASAQAEPAPMPSKILPEFFRNEKEFEEKAVSKVAADNEAQGSVEQLENLGLDPEEEAAALAQPSPAPAVAEQAAPEVAENEASAQAEPVPMPSEKVREFLRDQDAFEKERAQAT